MHIMQLDDLLKKEKKVVKLSRMPYVLFSAYHIFMSQACLVLGMCTHTLIERWVE
jgi:hypothetical protein